MAAASSVSAETLDQYKAKGQTAVVFGYSGATGLALVKDLLEQKIFSKLLLLGRREIDLGAPTYDGVEQKVIDFEKLEESEALLQGVDVAYCCLGTTKGKAGANGFYKVDHDYIMGVANLARRNNVSQFHLVSSMGANKNSMLLYIKTKGQVEAEVTDLKFPHCYIYRPGGLLAEREERRISESIGKILLKPVVALAPTKLTIPVETLARAMINLTVTSPAEEGAAVILENKEIHAKAK